MSRFLTNFLAILSVYALHPNAFADYVSSKMEMIRISEEFAKEKLQPEMRKGIESDLRYLSADEVERRWKDDTTLWTFVSKHYPELQKKFIASDKVNYHMATLSSYEVQSDLVKGLKKEVPKMVDALKKVEEAREAIDRYLDKSNISPPEFKLFLKILSQHALDHMQDSKKEEFHRETKDLKKDKDIFKEFIHAAGPHFQKLLQGIAREKGLNPEFAKILREFEENGRFDDKTYHEDRFTRIYGYRNGNKFGEGVQIHLTPAGSGTMAITFPGRLIEDRKWVRAAFRDPRQDIAKDVKHEYASHKELIKNVESRQEFKGTIFEHFGNIYRATHQNVMDEMDYAEIVRMQTNAAKEYQNKPEALVYARGEIADVHVSKIYRLDDDVIVMEWLDGESYDDFFKRHPELREKVAQDVAKFWLREAFFLSGVHHADPHMGNLKFVLKGDKRVEIQLLDFGLAKTVSREERTALLELAIALQGQDIEQIARLTSSKHLLEETASLSDRRALAVDALREKMSIETYLNHLHIKGLVLTRNIISFQRGALLVNQALKNAGLPDNTFASLAQKMAMDFLLEDAKSLLRGEKKAKRLTPFNDEQLIKTVVHYLKNNTEARNVVFNDLVKTAPMLAFARGMVENAILGQPAQVIQTLKAANVRANGGIMALAARPDLLAKLRAPQPGACAAGLKKAM